MLVLKLLGWHVGLRQVVVEFAVVKERGLGEFDGLAGGLAGELGDDFGC